MMNSMPDLRVFSIWEQWMRGLLLMLFWRRWQKSQSQSERMRWKKSLNRRRRSSLKRFQTSKFKERETARNFFWAKTAESQLARLLYFIVLDKSFVKLQRLQEEGWGRSQILCQAQATRKTITLTLTVKWRVVEWATAAKTLFEESTRETRRRQFRRVRSIREERLTNPLRVCVVESHLLCSLVCSVWIWFESLCCFFVQWIL